MHRQIVPAIVIAACLLPAVSTRASTARVGSDAQQVSGWGCFQLQGLGDQPASTQQLFYDLKMTYVRLELRPECGRADGTVDTGAMDRLAAQIKLARRHGVDGYILSVWSPPDGMKAPETTHLGRSSSGAAEYLNPTFEGRFVHYLVAAVSYLCSTGCPPPIAISIQNEPDAEPEPWDGCRYVDTADHRQLWRDIVVKLRHKLDAAGLRNVTIIGPETSKCGNAAELLDSSDGGVDPGVGSALGGIAYHSYDVSRAGDMMNAVRSLDKPMWMTEWSDVGQDDDLVAAVDMTRRLCSDLVDMHTNYWTWWYGWRPWPNFNGEELFVTDSAGNVHMTRLYGILRTLWSNVRPGWRVAPMISDDPDLAGAGIDRGWPQAEMVAFRSPKHRKLAILICNHTKRSKMFTFEGLPAGKAIATVYEWSDSPTMAKCRLTVSNGRIPEARIPAYGVQLYVVGPSP